MQTQVKQQSIELPYNFDKLWSEDALLRRSSVCFNS